jgi:hypothetical protein
MNLFLSFTTFRALSTFVDDYISGFSQEKSQKKMHTMSKKENAYTTIKMSELKYIAGGGLVVVNW